MPKIFKEERVMVVMVMVVMITAINLDRPSLPVIGDLKLLLDLQSIHYSA